MLKQLGKGYICHTSVVVNIYIFLPFFYTFLQMVRLKLILTCIKKNGKSNIKQLFTDVHDLHQEDSSCVDICNVPLLAPNYVRALKSLHKIKQTEPQPRFCTDNTGV